MDKPLGRIQSSRRLKRKSAAKRRRLIFYSLLVVLILIVTNSHGKNKPANKQKVTAKKIARQTSFKKKPPKKLDSYFCYLSGEKLKDKTTSERQPILIKVDNSPSARPQSGLDKADIVYETLAEDGYTRFAAIFLCDEASSVGPVRGARLTDISILSQYNAIFAHWSGTGESLKAVKTSGISDLDQTTYGKQAYWTKNSRKKPYNLYTGTEELRKVADTLKREAGLSQGFNFKNEKPADWPISSFTVNFSKKSAAVYKYEKQSNSFLRFQSTKPHIDALTGTQIRVKNVVVLSAKVDNLNKGQSNYNLTGEGAAAFYINGRKINGRWTANADSLPTFYDENGALIEFNPGNTWIEVVSKLVNNQKVNISKNYKNVIKKAPYQTNKIAITFDDGPSGNTGEVIDILKKYNAKATFFFVGYKIAKFGNSLKNIVDAGFEIGNHSYNHIDLKNLKKERVLSEIQSTDNEIYKYMGLKTIFVRPPAGHYDDLALKVIKKSKHFTALWSVHSQDTKKISSEEIAATVLKHTFGGSIVLMHETNPKTVKALPSILAGLRDKGLEPVTLSQLLFP